MSFSKELFHAFDQLNSLFEEDQNTAIFHMTYAEFSLNCYVGYADRIYGSMLSDTAPLTRAFLSIGVDTPRDQLLILLDTFSLPLHTTAKQPC